MKTATADPVERLAALLTRLADRQHKGLRLLTFAKLCRDLGMSRETAYRARKVDPRFPKPVQIPGSNDRYVEHEKDEYIRQLVADREASLRGAA